MFKGKISIAPILMFVLLLIGTQSTFAQDPAVQLTVTPSDVVIAGEPITVEWVATSTADSLYLHIIYHFSAYSVPDTTWLAGSGESSTGEKTADTFSDDMLLDVDIIISTGDDPFGPGEIVSHRVSVQHRQQHAQPPTAAEPCPASGVWPPGCEAPPSPPVGDAPCPASGVWPAGCNPNLPPSSAETCVIPPSGPWPSCATAGDPPPANTPDDCVIPPSGKWPPCAMGGSPIDLDPNRYYRLQTMFLENENKCLEGNSLADWATLGGAAFMDDCQDVSGQLWKFVPAENGYYRLQTMFLENEGKCLEGNRLAEDSTLGGAAFMDDCQSVSGQLWRLVESEAAGYYRLQTKFLENENKCLEGNRLADWATLGGAAFMDDCQDVSGQLWKVVVQP